jgi:hypothetical protein
MSIHLRREWTPPPSAPIYAAGFDVRSLEALEYAVGRTDASCAAAATVSTRRKKAVLVSDASDAAGRARGGPRPSAW